MSETSAYIALALACVICLALAAYAAKLLLALRQQQHEQAEQEAKQAQKRAETQKYVIESLGVISQAIEAQQIDLGEASIRVASLMEFFPEDDFDREPYQVFFHLRAALAHIPQKDEFKALPAKQRQAYHQQISEQEDKFRDFILEANKSLRGDLAKM